MTKKSLKKWTKKKVDEVFDIDWKEPLSVLSGAGQYLIETDPKKTVATMFRTPFDYVMAGTIGKMKEKFLYDTMVLKRKGKLPDGFLNDGLNQRAYVDIAKAIDENDATDEVIEAMLGMFVKMVNSEDKEKFEIYTYLRTLKRLDSLEFNIIMSSYRLRKNGRADQKKPRTKDDWRRYVLEELGLNEIMLYEIEKRENHLVDLRLLESHPGQDSNNLPQTEHCRLTGLGIKIGDIITSKSNSKKNGK